MKRIDKLEQAKLATTKTWAQTAAQNALRPSLLSKNSAPLPSSMVSSAAGLPETRREERDIIVNTNTNVNKEHQGTPATHAETREKEAKMLALINRTLATSKVTVLRDAKIGAAKMLPSGDWRISTAIPKWTELLRIHSNQWMITIGPRASIAIATYGVIVDGIRVETANLDNQKDVIEELQRQNCGVLTPERKIAS
ncbi:MAG: hypothetical protein Q9223_005664, partial [Gallowayella weberi]